LKASASAWIQQLSCPPRSPPTMQAAAVATTATAGASTILTLGKPVAMHLLKGSPSAAHLAPPKPRNLTISGATVNLQLSALVAIMNASWTLAANSRSCRMKRKQISCHTMNADVTESMQQRQRLEYAWRLPAVRKHVAPSKNADTEKQMPRFSEQPTHWTKPFAALLVLVACSHLFIYACMVVIQSHHGSDTVLHTLTTIITMRQLRKLCE